MVANRVKKPVYVDTNFGTHVVVLVSVKCTTKHFKKKFLRAHYCCYPDRGKLNVHSLQVKHKSEFTGIECLYTLSESIPIEYALGGEDRRLHIEASKSELEEFGPLENKRLKKKRKKKKFSVDEHSQLMFEECSLGNHEVEHDEYSNLACEECGSGDNGNELLLCDKCDRGFHLYCLRPVLVRVPTGIWYCPICLPRLPRISEQTTLTLTEVMHFFGIKNFMEPMEKLPSAKDSRKRRSLVLTKKTGRLLAYEPAKDESQRLQQMASLAYALMALNMSFSPQLTYVPGMAPRSANEPKFENGGMQVLAEKDKDTLNYVHAMGKMGLFPPLMVVYNSVEGFTVEAGGPIKDWTLVAEFAGDVDYWMNREYDDCNSLMTLLSAKDTAKTLVICPDKRGNIARFISGINNTSPDSKEKQNLKCVRYDINGECRALFVAIRDIAKGERLYYDYNGQEYGYPTHNFL